ncbi:MAG TPA: cbb3-type cytochrome c oxidase subunit I, partial [Herpetosiphonaceae bacterium]|nr:cbb3-type cytochrome c oxidase subunit I [Herpetosiphonaceae bacterium]
FGGAIMALFGAFYYWWPKMFGRMLSERLGKIHFWLAFVGMNLAFFPQHYLGLIGMPRRIYTYPRGLGFDFWNLMSTLGALTIGLSVLVFIINVLIARRNGTEAPADPWDGHTLEWGTSSPPPPHNFDAVPVVRSRRPVWDLKYGEAPHGTAMVEPRDVKAAGSPEDDVPHSIHLPPPSFYPIVLAFGLTVAAYALLYSSIVGIFVGISITFIAVGGLASEAAKD